MTNLCRCNIAARRQVDDSRGECVPREIWSLVVVLDEVFQEGHHVVALAKNWTTSHEGVNDSLLKDNFDSL